MRDPSVRRTQRHVLCLATLVLGVAAGLALAAPAAVGANAIPIAGELAFCNGEPVAPVDGVLYLEPGCVLNLQIVWLPGMKSAYLEYSPDGGSTWVKHPLPAVFPPVPVGHVSGVGLGACDVLLSGTYLFRAHGFRSPNEHGNVFSAPFPYSVGMTCP